MTDSRRLARTVWVDGRRYGPDDTVPADVAARIRNPKAWTTEPRPGGAAAEMVKPGVGDGPRLARTVHVDGRAYRPGDHVPAEVAARIRNPKAWAVPPTSGAAERSVVDQSTEPVVTADQEADTETVAADAEITYLDPAGADDDAEGSALPQPPARAGRGSGLDAWQRFAADAGVEHDPDATRDQIITACVQAGVIPAE